MFRKPQSDLSATVRHRTHDNFASREEANVVVKRIPHRFSSVAANVSPHWYYHTPSPHIAFLLSFCAYRNFYPLLIAARRPIAAPDLPPRFWPPILWQNSQ
jgi:hypothetical protein